MHMPSRQCAPLQGVGPAMRMRRGASGAWLSPYVLVGVIAVAPDVPVLVCLGEGIILVEEFVLDGATRLHAVV